jgi:hypothetical protein
MTNNNFFDWKYYIDNYPDLKRANINTEAFAIQHWNNYGQHEGRECNRLSFDWEYYINRYSDLKKAGINTEAAAIQHWNNHGQNEGRYCNRLSFDWEYYIDRYYDLQKAGINTKVAAYNHWNKYGKQEKRIYNYINLNSLIDTNICCNNEYYLNDRLIENIKYNNNNNNNNINNILIIASYPINLIYMNQLLYLTNKFKKIYFVYSDVNYINDFENQDIFKNKKIILIKVDNIGYDFYKYYIGIKNVLNNNDEFNKLWLINDSFFCVNWDNLFNKINLDKINNNDYISLCESNELNLNHFQSYLLIMNKTVTNIYYDAFNKYNFIYINTNDDKNKIILDLEVKLSNKIKSKDDIKSITLIKYIDSTNILNIFKQFNYDDKTDLFKVNNNNFNQSMYINCLNLIFKNNYITTPFNIKYINYVDSLYLKLLLCLNLHTPLVKLYNLFYNSITYKISSDNANINMYELFNINSDSIQMINSKFKNNIIYKLAKIINCSESNIIISLSIIKFIKNYNKEDNILNIKNDYFSSKVNEFTTLDDLKKNIQNIQKNSGNKKVIYTNNINSYDLFWDIDNIYLEDDVDYIYISNVNDKKVCKNFKFILCNLDSDDSFYLNRKIKFDKTLFDCYDKVLYIDSNVQINSKLNTFFNLLDNNDDLVLFTHPQRNNINEELNELIKNNENNNHIKWNLNLKLINEIKNENINLLENKLYWQNIILSNSKYNIYDDINILYKKYQLKRDQIFFGLIQKKFKIKCQSITCSNILSEYIYMDGDYGYVNNWSDKFNRPFGGHHI